MPFQTIATQRLYQQVAEQIAAAIRAGELRTGERLPPERDLAKRFGVSRPTVREAMVALEIAGLVDVRTGSGIYVRAGDGSRPQDLYAGPGAFEVLAARALIEPEIARVAADTIDEATLDTLRETIAAIESAADHRASQAADRMFHVAIASATGNGVLIAIVEELWDHMVSPIFDGLSAFTGLPESRRMTLADHRTILECLSERDGPAVRRAMRVHLDRVRTILETSEAAAPARAALD